MAEPPISTTNTASIHKLDIINPQIEHISKASMEAQNKIKPIVLPKVNMVEKDRPRKGHSLSYMASKSSRTSIYCTVFGYLVGSDWLYNFGIEEGLKPDFPGTLEDEVEDEVDWEGAVIGEAMDLLVEEAGVPAEWVIAPYKKIVTSCLTFASKDPYDTRPVPSEDDLSHIKKLLKTHENPKWRHAYND